MRALLAAKSAGESRGLVYVGAELGRIDTSVPVSTRKKRLYEESWIWRTVQAASWTIIAARELGGNFPVAGSRGAALVCGRAKAVVEEADAILGCWSL